MKEIDKAKDIEQLIYRELPPDRYCYIHNFIVEKDKEIERLNKENTILRQNSQYLVKQKDELEEDINKAIEYIENEMPCLWEIDKEWEDQEDNYHHTYKEYDTQILLNKLKGVDKE